MLEFKKKSLQIKIYGKEYNVSFPTVGQVQRWVKDSKKGAEEDQNDLLMEFLEELGLPKDVFQEMYPEDAEQLVGMLIPAKKK